MPTIIYSLFSRGKKEYSINTQLSIIFCGDAHILLSNTARKVFT